MIPWRLELDETEARARFEWARRRGHPQHLWPAVTPGQRRAAAEEIGAATASVLAARSASLTAPTLEAARALGVAAYTTGLGPLLGRWIETGRLDADPLVAELLQLHLDHGRRRATRLRTELGRATGVLTEVGIGPVVVKSAHTAVTYFPEPGTRPAMDIDLVVPAGRFDHAEATLGHAGYTLGARQYRPRKSTWLAPGSSQVPRSLELVHADSQYAIDLHASLDRNFFGVRTVSPGGLDDLSRTSPPELDLPVRVLPQPALLLYHALHASEGLYNLTLIRLVELVLMIRADRRNGRLDWPAFRALVDAREAWRFVYPALSMTERLAPGTVDPAVIAAASRAAPARMARVLDRASPAGAQRLETRAVDEMFMWCDRPVDYLRRSIHVLFPAPAGRSPALWLRYHIDRVRRLLRRTITLRRSERPPR